MLLGERIKRLRESRDWTQAELAVKIGTGQGYVADVENGQRPNPKGSTLQKFAKAFGMTLGEFLAPVGDSLKDERVDTYAYIRELGLDDEEQVKLRDFADMLVARKSVQQQRKGGGPKSPGNTDPSSDIPGSIAEPVQFSFVAEERGTYQL